MKNKYFLVMGLIFTSLVPMIFAARCQAQITDVKYNNTVKNPVNINALEHRIFDLINLKRAENGLESLVWSEQIAAVARLHSANMTNFDFFSHIGIDGKQVDDRADSLGLRKWRMIGENIAYNTGFDDPAERAISSWMLSAGHRKNILRDSWNETGIGISVSPKGKYFITQVFLQRK
jgi:uncharacterized protein YkwD